jgi:hypothetical protein
MTPRPLIDSNRFHDVFMIRCAGPRGVALDLVKRRPTRTRVPSGASRIRPMPQACPVVLHAGRSKRRQRQATNVPIHGPSPWHSAARAWGRASVATNVTIHGPSPWHSAARAWGCASVATNVTIHGPSPWHSAARAWGCASVATNVTIHGTNPWHSFLCGRDWAMVSFTWT